MADHENSILEFNSVRHRLEDYGEQVEDWNNDHERALHCMEFELLLGHGLSLLSQVNTIDEKIRLKMFREEIEYDARFDDVLENYYKWWLKPCDKLLKELNLLEQEGFSIERAGEFRAACREVQGILTVDNQFFSGNALTDLRDQAIDEHRAGRCEPA